MAKLHNRMSWPSWILGINLWLMFVSALFSYVHDGFLKWRILNRFNLAGEMNLAIWWSGSLLLLCGIIAYQFSTWDSASKAAWIAIAFLFSVLSFDEIGSIHERVGNLAIGREAYLAAALSAGMTLTFATFVLWKDNANRRTLVLLLASAAPNEYLEHHILWPEYLIGPGLVLKKVLN